MKLKTQEKDFSIAYLLFVKNRLSDVVTSDCWKLKGACRPTFPSGGKRSVGGDMDTEILPTRNVQLVCAPQASHSDSDVKSTRVRTFKLY